MPAKLNHAKLERALRDLLAHIPTGEWDRGGLTDRKAKRLAKEIRAAIQRLGHLAREIDPIRQPPTVFDPYQPKELGRFTGETLIVQPKCPLGSLSHFYGAGVYALYYRGNFSAYQPIQGR